MAFAPLGPAIQQLFKLQIPSLVFAPSGPAIKQLFKFIPYEFVIPDEFVDPVELFGPCIKRMFKIVPDYFVFVSQDEIFGLWQ